MAPDTRETDLAFRFGFLLHGQDVRIDAGFAEGWHAEVLEGLRLYAHPECRITRYETASARVLVLGDHFVCAGSEPLDRVVAAFAEAGDWDALDNLSGRFALLLLRPDRQWIVQDPFGSRTLYYHTGAGVCLASHAALAAGALGLSIDEEVRAFTRSPEYRSRKTIYLPGNITMYPAVRSLTPNCYYDIVDRTVARFWPRKPLQPTTRAKLLEAADEYFANFSRYLREHYHPILGLTGGVDTRTLIAGLGAKGVSPDLVTWAGFAKSEKPAIEEMRRHLGLSHTYIDPKDQANVPPDQKVLMATRRASGFSRGKSNLGMAISRIHDRPTDSVFVNGHGGEIMRGFYNYHLLQDGQSLPLQDLPEDFSRLYLSKNLTTHSSPDSKNFMIQAFRTFLESAGYGAPLFDHDVLDLFYWEHRMGTWGGNKLNQLDPVIPGMTGFNSRHLYAAAFGLPPQERFSKRIMLDITARYDAELARIGAAPAPSAAGRGQRRARSMLLASLLRRTNLR